MPNNVFTVQRDELNHALKMLLIAAKGSSPPDLIVYSENDNLVLKVGGMIHRIPGNGSIIGKAYLPGQSVKNIKVYLPEDQTINISRSEDKIKFGNFQISCRCITSTENFENTIPVNLSFIETLGLRERFPLERIREFGLLSKLNKAEERKHSLIIKAVNDLSDFSVGYSQIEELVNEAIRKTNIR